MKKIIKNILTFCIIIASVSFGKISAAPAYPGLINYKQANGTTIKITLQGDEFVKWALTEDGYTLLINSEGNYEYAVKDGNGDLQLSNIVATNMSERTTKAINLLNNIEKRLYYSKDQISILKSIWDIKATEQTRSFPTTGNRRLICILMGFKDKSFTKTQSDFNNLFNQVEYNAGGATGSVKDYYLENSWNQFNLTVDVFGPYTASQNMSYYGGNGSGGNDANPRALVTEAVNLVDPVANFANYDNDNDGSVDGVYIIYAGYGEEAGGGANCIWAHAWSISPVVKDGKTISRYSCSAELRGASGSTITAIGVICHEFGHVLGAPDYYDTNYGTGGEFSGTGYWDMMASGSWNNNGVTPAHHNVYTKTKIYNWATTTVLNSQTNVTVLNAENNKSFYQINSTTANEYWLIENRQKVSFDSYIPGHGLIIYHVHKDIATASASNNVNATYPQKMYPVCANATTNPSSTSASYGSINSGGCPFPGTSNIVSFTDQTTPSMTSWANANTGKPITNIVENATTKAVTFSFMNSSPSTTYNIPFTENFTGAAIPSGWTTNNTGTGITERWSFSNTTNAGGVAGEMKCSWQKISPATARLITPAINTVGINKVTLSFKHMLDAYSTGVTLKVQTSNNKVDWLNTSWSVASTSSNISAITVDIEINTNLNSETTYFAFIAEGNLYQIDYWYIDNISITASTAQAEPQVTTAMPNSITTSSAICGGNIIFANTSEIVERGICYSVSTNPTTANNKIAAGNGAGTFTANLSGLNANTKYYIKAYAKTATTTYYGNELSFTTANQSVVYCGSKGTNSNYEWIDLVKFAGIDRVSGNDGGYKDMTSMKATVSVGNTYPIYISCGFKSSAYNEYWAIWIDYNKNGIFEDSEKAVVGSSSSSETLTANITIPANAVIGTTRMRVSMKYNAAQTACENFGYGEVEDYSVEINNNNNAYAYANSQNAIPLTFSNNDIFNVFPNPAKDVLNVKINNLLVATNAKIIDITGKVVKQFIIDNSESNIDINDLNKGFYILSIDNEKEPFVKKFVKM